MELVKRGWILLCALALLVGLSGRAGAFYVDDKNTLSFGAKAETRVSFRLQDSSGFTQPEVKMGDLAQWRNLALLEVDHDLRELTKTLDILYPLKRLDIRAKYRLVGRFMYEAVYDVGSDNIKAVRDNDKENIDTFKQSYDLWEAYLDLSRGPLFVRIGKQNVAWGETDIFRLLDGINPLDNTFGGPFEALDDRRIPLWMLRGSYNLGRVGPVSSFTVEGFWVPGSLDVRVGPWAPYGTPYAVPLDKASVYDILYINPPAKKMENSRWGARIQGMLGADMTVSAAYYRTFLDSPTTHFVLTEPVEGPLLDTSLLRIDGDYPYFEVLGASMNWWESMLDVVFRAEIAHFFGEPVFIQGINDAPLHAPVLPLPWPVLDILSTLGSDVRSAGLYGLPISPESGPIPKLDVLRWMIGFDKQLWIRALNPVNMFFTSFQYFGQWYYKDYDPGLIIPVPVPDLFLARPNELTGQPIPDMTQFPHIKEVGTTFTGMINTMYMKGTLIPQFAFAYDTTGAWLFLPSIQYIKEPFRFGLQYAGIVGQFNSFGLFRDRDQITFTLTYLLN